MKDILLLSVAILCCGFGLSLFSYFPQPSSVPYLKTVQQSVNTVQEDGAESGFYTYYSKSFTCGAGDTIYIRAQVQTTGYSLSIIVSDLLGNNIMRQDNVNSIDTTVTIPNTGYYTVTVERYRIPFEYFFAKTSAYIYVKTSITETSIVQDYKIVTIYPYKDLIMPGIAIMLAGIGIGVISIAQEYRS